MSPNLFLFDSFDLIWMFSIDFRIIEFWFRYAICQLHFSSAGLAETPSNTPDILYPQVSLVDVFLTDSPKRFESGERLCPRMKYSMLRQNLDTLHTWISCIYFHWPMTSVGFYPLLRGSAGRCSTISNPRNSRGV